MSDHRDDTSGRVREMRMCSNSFFSIVQRARWVERHWADKPLLEYVRARRRVARQPTRRDGAHMPHAPSPSRTRKLLVQTTMHAHMAWVSRHRRTHAWYFTPFSNFSSPRVVWITKQSDRASDGRGS